MKQEIQAINNQRKQIRRITAEIRNMDSQHFDPHFPEQFAWQSIDSRLGSDLGERLARVCQDDLRTPDRLLAPGLRRALNELARRVGVA